MTSTAKPRVALIGTGGTISSIGRDSLDVWEYMDTSRKAEPDELLQRFPEVAGAAEIVTVRFRAVGSTAIGPADWLALDAAVHDAVARQAPLDGVVITHGTATLEETAYFLNLTLKVDVPVVVVGAQRPATGLSSDAAMNLLNAVRVAAAPEARGLGVLVAAQRRDPGRARGDQGLDAPGRDLPQPRTSGCSATPIPTAASPSTGGRRGATRPTRSSTCAAARSCRASTSRRRTPAPTARPSTPSSPPAPGRSSRRRCRRA